MGTVLVVEDESGIAELLDAVLTDEGYRVLTGSNGRQGLEVLTKEHVDLVFLDFMMPVMDGAGMLRRMSSEASLRDIPVVLMSSLPEAAVAERCSGYAAFLRKPFRIVDAVTMTERLIGKSTTSSP